VVGDLLRAHARLTPQGPFLTCGAGAFGFAALDARTDAVAAGLAAAGVAWGDRVAIVCANRIEMVELFFAVAKLGAIQVPLNAYLKGEFLRYQLADSRASALVVDASGHTAVAPLLADLPELRLLVLLDEPAIATAAPHIQVRRYTELPVSQLAPVVEIAPADLMSIV
jgi:carnitine-CoA ligase